jgi:hypothetical protein
MTQYIKADGAVFPYTDRMMKQDNRNTSFPANINDEARASVGVYPVTIAAKPAHDPATQVVTQDPPQEVNGAWIVGWTVRDKTAEESAADRVRDTARVQAEMSRRLRLLAVDYEDAERETWATQVDEAKAIKVGATTAPILAPLAAVKGRTLDEQADRVLYLADAFARASGAIMAARDMLLVLDSIPADFAEDKYWP